MEGFRAYLTAEGRLVPNQEQAGKGFTQVTVPYKKADLLAFINDRLARAEANGRGLELDKMVDPPVVFEVEHDTSHLSEDPAYGGEGPIGPAWRKGEKQPKAWDGEGLYHSIAQGRTQGVDRVCGLIFNADPVTLSRYATSVSMGYERLAKGG